MKPLKSSVFQVTFLPIWFGH